MPQKMETNASTVSRHDSPLEQVCRELHDSFADDKFQLHKLLALSQAQCRRIRETYMELYEEDLVRILDRYDQGLSFLHHLMIDPFERDAITSREALHSGVDVNYKALLEVFTCRRSSHVFLTLQAYHARYGVSLDLDIASIDPPHAFQKILMALSASHNAHDTDHISQHIAKCDAMRLFKTGEGRPGAIDEAVVLEIFSKRSIAQLKQLFFCYKQIYGHSYASFLKRECSGEFEDAVRVVAKCICCPTRYYAKIIRGCLQEGKSIDESTLTRVIVSRAEVDMEKIREKFYSLYGLELKNVICEVIPEGYYRDFLVVLASKSCITW